MILIGIVLDFIEIVFVVVPIVAPALLAMGVDPVWLGVMMAINLQTSFLTRPVGFALFYLRGVAPPGLNTGDIYRGVMPFIGLQLLMLGLLLLWPGLATWLPGVLYQTSAFGQNRPFVTGMPESLGGLNTGEGQGLDVCLTAKFSGQANGS